MDDPVGDRLFPMWVVYRFPLDYPTHYVVRVHWATTSGRKDMEDIGCLYNSYAEAMFDCEAMGLTWIGRHPKDEPQIIGVWM